jgi:hypothetical protein
MHTDQVTYFQLFERLALEGDDARDFRDAGECAGDVGVDA